MPSGEPAPLELEDLRPFVAEVAELQVRRYFDHYLAEVWPAQKAQITEDLKTAVTAHNQDQAAHGGVERRFDRFFWTMMGLAAASGMGLGTSAALLIKTTAVLTGG